MKAPASGESDNEQEALHYNVVQLGADQIALLPDNPLTWTSVAYLLWDEIDPGEPFPAEQKNALVDWLHWGGQLIISGPNSLDKLRGSFLAPYLHGEMSQTAKLTQADFHQLRRDLLASAVPLYEEFVRQSSADAKLEAERGRAYNQLAHLRA